jgi:hypothetical protein
MPTIPWYTGEIEYEAARRRAKQDIESVGNLGRGARGVYDAFEANRQRNKQEKAAYLRSLEGRPDQEQAAQEDAEQNLPADIESETGLPEDSLSGPSPSARNLSAAVEQGTGGGGPDPDMAEAMEPGVFAGDESPIFRAIRRIGQYARVPGVGPTKPGPSTVERTALLAGEQDKRARELEAIRAISGAAQHMQDPMAQLRGVAPNVMRGVPGGERYIPAKTTTRDTQREELIKIIARKNGREGNPTKEDYQLAFKIIPPHPPPAAALGSWLDETVEETDPYGLEPEVTRRTRRQGVGAPPEEENVDDLDQYIPSGFVPGHPEIPIFK